MATLNAANVQQLVKQFAVKPYAYKYNTKHQTVSLNRNVYIVKDTQDNSFIIVVATKKGGEVVAICDNLQQAQLLSKGC